MVAGRNSAIIHWEEGYGNRSGNWRAAERPRFDSGYCRIEARAAWWPIASLASRAVRSTIWVALSPTPMRPKEALLGVKRETLIAHGAVSEETAQEMARGARERLGADLGIATTGIAGPTGSTRRNRSVWFTLPCRRPMRIFASATSGKGTGRRTTSNRRRPPCG